MSGDATNPSHYKGKGGLQPIDIIEAFDLGFNLGNAVKYLCRERNKNGKEDLQKAIWYIEREISNRPEDHHDA